jgi:hypothetical protein
MSLLSGESWLYLPEYWTENGFNCDANLEIEIRLADIIDGSNQALLELELKPENCFNGLTIYNKAAAGSIILNFQNQSIKIAQSLKVIGPMASLTMISSEDAYFHNITTSNIKEIFYVSGVYDRLEMGHKLLHDILYDRKNAGIWINNWHSKTALVISSAKIVLAGEIKIDIHLKMEIHGLDNHGYNLETKNLVLLNTHLLKISDFSTSGTGISLFGNINGFHTVIDGYDFVLGGKDLTAQRFISFFKGTADISGKLSAAEISILSNDLKIQNSGEIRSINFQAPNHLFPATSINLKVKTNFSCEERGTIFSNACIIIEAGTNFYYNGIAEAKSHIRFEGEALNKEIGSLANIISHQGNVTTKTLGSLVVNGVVVAHKGFIRYRAGEYFMSNGLNAGELGVEITQISSNLLKVEINKVDDSLIQRWQKILVSENNIIGSLISFANRIIINADIVILNNCATILNFASLDKAFSDAGNVQIIADKYIYHHAASNIIANGDIIERAEGQDTKGFGIIFSGGAHVESKEGASKITAQQRVQLNGDLTGDAGVFIDALCMENNNDATIHGLRGEVKINLSNCYLNNFGRIYSNTNLIITNDGGDIENHNILAGDDMKLTVHGRKNLINYGIIYSKNNVRIALELDAKILLKPGSIMYVGSYDFGHFSDLVRLRIGEVDCHGCSIQTIKSTTSIISANILSVRITDYKKKEFKVSYQKTFTTKIWKDVTKRCGIVVDVKHRQSHATLTLLENDHSYYGPALVSHKVGVELDVGLMLLEMSSFTGGGEASFLHQSTLKIVSEQSEQKVVAYPGSITHMNTPDNVKNAFFGTASVDVTNKDGNLVFIKPKDTINAVFAFSDGIKGDFQKIRLGSSESYLGCDNSVILPSTHNSALASKIMADITIDNASKEKTIIGYYWRSDTLGPETITPKYLQTYGLEISKFIDYRILNPIIWNNILSDQQAKVESSVNPDELNLRPIFFLTLDPLLTQFIHEPLNIVHFLASLAFSQKGLVYTLGDGHFITKLVDQAVFILLGLLSGVDHSKLLQSLAVNAIAEQTLQNLVAGNPLTPTQIQDLTSSIIWPIWRDNCLGDEKCLDFKLYFNDEALKNSLSGAVIASEGNIDLKILGDVLIGLTGQIKSGKAIKFYLQGNFLSLGMATATNGIAVTAENIGNAGKFNIGTGDVSLDAVYDIVNIGSSMIKEGNVYLKAGHDIKELTLINPAILVPELTKRAIYAVGGSLYYEAANDVVQQASVILASGNIAITAGHDIIIKTIHKSRIVKEEYSKIHYLIQRTIDQYDAIIIVNGGIEMTAGYNFIGSGIKLSTNAGDVNIIAGNEAILEDTTGSALNYKGASKSTVFSRSQISVTWSTDKTAKLEITAPGGKIYISSKECTLEGGILNGAKTIFKCDKLEIKPHKIIKTLDISASKTGLLAKVPAIDLVQSNNPEGHIRDNTVAGPINALMNMQGAMDLLPAINVISSIPGLKADYQLLKGSQAGFSPAALFGALLSKYISTSISISKQKMHTSVTQTTSHLSQMNGDQCDFIGLEGSIAGNINCKSKVNMEYDNLKITGAQNSIYISSETSTSSFNVGTSLNGVSFGVSFSEDSFQHNQVTHDPGTIYSQNILIKINDKLEIENAQINGEHVEVEAVIIKIKQVIDSSSSEGKNRGTSMGINIGWNGDITPIISTEYAKMVKQSQVVQFISGITGESVEVTAKILSYNIEAITAKKDLKIVAENLDYISMPYVENIDTETQIAASISPRSDGKTNYFVSIYSRDGNKVMSMAWGHAFAEGLNDIMEAFEKEEPAQTNNQIYYGGSGEGSGEETSSSEKKESKSKTKDSADNDPIRTNRYRSAAEYKTLQSKGINVNNRMSFDDDKIDGEFLSKLNTHEYYIDGKANKVVVSLGVGSNGKPAYKDYDLAQANQLRQAYGSKSNDAIWNYKQHQAISELSNKLTPNEFSYEEFKNNELSKSKWKFYDHHVRNTDIPQGTAGLFNFDSDIVTDYSLHEDPHIDNYLRKAYGEYQKHGEDVMTTPPGLIVDSLGETIKDFKKEYPKTTAFIKTVANGIKESIECFVDPLLKTSSEFGDAVYDLTIGRETKEALYQSEKKLWYEAGQQYEKSFTNGQKEVMNFGLDALEVVGVGQVVKQLAKAGIKQVIKSDFHFDNDFLNKYSFTDDLNKIDFETAARFDLGKISDTSKHQVLNKLPNYGTVHKPHGKTENFVNLDNIVNPDLSKVTSSASTLHKSKDMTMQAHALSKHSGRNPDTWGKISGSYETWDKMASKHIEDIIHAPGDFKNVLDPNTGIIWVEKRLQDGRGLRLNRDYTFKGFVD